MGPAIGPSLAGQDIDIEGRGSAGDGQPSSEFGWGDALRANGAQLDQRAECPSGEIEIGERVGGRSIQGAGGAQQLHEGIEAQGVFAVIGSCNDLDIAHQPSGVD